MAPLGLGPSRRRVKSTTLRITSLAAGFIAVGIAISAVVELIDGGDEAVALLVSAAICAVFAVVGWTVSEVPGQIPSTSAFAAVSWGWVGSSLLGAIPYVATGTLSRLDDALFESISGFTCTGSTVIADIDGQGAGILFWRALTQWYGGMGLIVLAVAVLPLLGVGGLELVSAEAPGPDTDRLTPRISETAKRLWLLYAGFTVAILLAYWAAGMDLYDSVTHSFATIATGGFSPRGGLDRPLRLGADRVDRDRRDDHRWSELHPALASGEGRLAGLRPGIGDAGVRRDARGRNGDDRAAHQ